MSSSECAPALLQIFEWVKEHGGEPIIPFSGILEAKIFDMPDDEKATYLKEVLLFPLRTCGMQRQGNVQQPVSVPWTACLG